MPWVVGGSLGAGAAVGIDDGAQPGAVLGRDGKTIEFDRATINTRAWIQMLAAAAAAPPNGRAHLRRGAPAA